MKVNFRVFFQIEIIQKLSRKRGVKMTVDCGQRNSRIRLQGQTKDVYQAESRIKEMLHKIKSEQTEHEQSVMLAQLVGSSIVRKYCIQSR